MKARIVWFTLGLVFAVSLAVVIGQRLSDEAMAVVVGVVAGVAASIPTSLMVVWFASRSLVAARPAPAAPPEPRVVVMTPPQPQAAYANPASFGMPMPAGTMYAPSQALLVPRQFNVIGGAEVMGVDAEQAAEVVWRP